MKKYNWIRITYQISSPLRNISAYIAYLYLAYIYEKMINDRSKERKMTFLDRLEPGLNDSKYKFDLTLDEEEIIEVYE